jgi:hypothetical protein
MLWSLARYGATRADMPCAMDYSMTLYKSMIYTYYYQAKIAIVNEDKILKYLTIDLFVVTYLF